MAYLTGRNLVRIRGSSGSPSTLSLLGECMDEAKFDQIAEAKFDLLIKLRNVGLPERINMVSFTLALVVIALHPPADRPLLRTDQLSCLVECVETFSEQEVVGVIIHWHIISLVQ